MPKSSKLYFSKYPISTFFRLTALVALLGCFSNCSEASTGQKDIDLGEGSSSRTTSSAASTAQEEQSSSEAASSTHKFNTQTAGFGSEYATLAHHQSTFNAGIIETLSDSIARWFPHSEAQPIRILDLCCGHGRPTYDLLRKLDEKSVHVSQIVGYDISSDQIAKARTTCEDPRLNFQVKNAEEITEQEEYDLVISLFGLHWMEDIKKTASSISNALKPGGKTMFFVPLEKMDLFEFRNSFLRESSWSQHFQDYVLHPFIADAGKYADAFSHYFEVEEAHTARGTRSILYPEEAFISFLSSWMQELRHLRSKSVDTTGYVKGLVDSIPQLTEGNVQKPNGGEVLFTEHFFSYQGTVRK